MTASVPRDLDFADRRVTVVGLGIEGVDAVRYLARQGAIVTVSDAKPREGLTERLAQISGLDVRLVLGSDQGEEIATAEAIVISQGVSLDLPGLRRARARSVPTHSMMSLFMDLCPGPIAGITGSSGKTTTTALLGEMFEADERPVFVGGNIGIGLLDRLDVIRAYTWSVLEISHTQLQLEQRSPHVAAVLNVTPNHLDRFSWDEYRHLKANILRFQDSGDTAVLNRDDPESRALEPLVKGRLLWFSQSSAIPGDGVCARDGWATHVCGPLARPLFRLDTLRLRGAHNKANALAAAALATACGISPEAIALAVESFRGVPHRLEEAGEFQGIRYYNDSIATTPERTVAGIHSFQEPLVLLLGGRDKDLPLDSLADAAVKRCRAVICFGEAAPKLGEAVRMRAKGSGLLLTTVDTLEEAVNAARSFARPGDAVLLSPACTSYDAYENFERRGEHFRSLVHQMIREVQPSLP